MNTNSNKKLNWKKYNLLYNKYKEKNRIYIEPSWPSGKASVL